MTLLSVFISSSSFSPVKLKSKRGRAVIVDDDDEDGNESFDMASDAESAGEEVIKKILAIYKFHYF